MNQPVRLSPAAPKGAGAARIAHCLAIARGLITDALPYAEGKEVAWSNTPGVVDCIRAAVTPIGTDAGITLARPVAADLRSVGAAPIIDRIGLRPAPSNVSVLRNAVVPAAGWVAQGAPIPVRALDLSRVTLESGMKIAGVCVVTAETAKATGAAAEAFLAAELSTALTNAADANFLDPQIDAVPNLRPASVTNGATAVPATGTTRSTIEADFRSLFAAFLAAGGDLARMVLVMQPRTALYIAQTLGADGAARLGARGGFLYESPVFTTTAAALAGSPGEGLIVAIDPALTVLVDDTGEISIDIATHATVQMSDTPAAGAQSLVSLWANGLAGFRLMRMVSWRRAGGGVAYIANVGY